MCECKTTGNWSDFKHYSTSDKAVIGYSIKPHIQTTRQARFAREHKWGLKNREGGRGRRGVYTWPCGMVAVPSKHLHSTQYKIPRTWGRGGGGGGGGGHSISTNAMYFEGALSEVPLYKGIRRNQSFDFIWSR